MRPGSWNFLCVIFDQEQTMCVSSGTRTLSMYGGRSERGSKEGQVDISRYKYKSTRPLTAGGGGSTYTTFQNGGVRGCSEVGARKSTSSLGSAGRINFASLGMGGIYKQTNKQERAMSLYLDNEQIFLHRDVYISYYPHRIPTTDRETREERETLKTTSNLKSMV